MILASPLLELVKESWGLPSKPLGYICNLKDNVDSLQIATEDLKAASKDVEAKVELEGKERDAQHTKQVAEWLGNMKEFVGRVDQVLREVRERDRINHLSRCLSRNRWSSYKLGKRVNQLLSEARELQQKRGELSDFTSPLPSPRVLEMPMDEITRLDISKLDKVWKWLVHEKQVRVIGLYGIGGVGKTALMKKINEELSRTNEFDVVIWVVMSRQLNEDRIQDDIRNRLHIKDEHWERWSWDERVHNLSEDLTQKKYVLLIDDLWERLDLSKIGVPRPSLENGSKIVFTTRSKQVCDQMVANKTFKVQCLTPQEALELFENTVGKSTVHSHPKILELAKDIVGECKGLPLALVTVGRAMTGKENPHEWKHVLRTLRNNPHKLSCMVEEVYHILEPSYSSLNDSTLQLCFLYCCLFPKDYHMRPHDLTRLWIGEGLLEDTDDVYKMQEKGGYVLERLKMDCLLESGRDAFGEYVKMHNIIRDMATWITCDRGQRENKLLVTENEEDTFAEMISKWGEAEKISLWGKWILYIDQAPPKCSKLETLFVRETNVRYVPRGFFNSMTAHLTVLDLSGNRNIQSFPEGICDLINLRYLNLSATWISELPRDIKNLTRLRWLLLDNTIGIFLIPTGAIANLPLNVFSKWGSDLENEEEMVEELGRMQHLIDLSISVCKSSSAQNIFQSPNLQSRIRRARITDSQKDLTHIAISYSPIDSNNFSHLEVLHLVCCGRLREMEITQELGRAPNCSCFPSLVEVIVRWCGLSSLPWLVHAPKLRELRVEECDSMEKIISDGFAAEELVASGLFSHLQSLSLLRLQKLTSICDRALFFPPGVAFRIVQCPGLRKLPLDSNSVRGGFSVFASAVWWAKFEWDPARRVTFQLDDEEMTFEEALRKIRDEAYCEATIRFQPNVPS